MTGALNGPDGLDIPVTFGKTTARAAEEPSKKKHPNSVYSIGANIDPYINGLVFGKDIKASNSVTQKGNKLNVTRFSYEKDGRQKPLATLIVTPDGNTKYVETGNIMYKANMNGEITDVLTGQEKKAQHIALFGGRSTTKGACGRHKA